MKKLLFPVALTVILWFSLIFSFINVFTLSSIELYWLIFIVFALGVNQSAFLHRAWTHKAWHPSRIINLLALFIHTITLFGPSYGWICVHRKHHRYSDTPKDPHSPLFMSRYKIFFWPYFNKLEAYYIADLIRDKDHQWFANNYWKINFAWLTIMYYFDILGLWFTCIGFILLCIHLIGAWLHNCPFSKVEGPGNSFFNSLFAWNGEAWHKNHHDDANSWNFSREWWQLDMSANLIRLLVFLRLAKHNKK